MAEKNKTKAYEIGELDHYLFGQGTHYEIYQNNHDEHPEKKFIVDICIPVEPV